VEGRPTTGLAVRPLPDGSIELNGPSWQADDGMARSERTARWGWLVLLSASCSANRSAKADASALSSATSPGKSQPGLARNVCPPQLTAARQGGSDADRYVVPSEAERAVLRQAISKLLAGGVGARAEASRIAAPIDFEIADVPDFGDTVLLRERASRRRGGGAYLFRTGTGAAAHPIVQAPHTFFDEGTLPLACELFERSGAQALFIETAHRYNAAGDDDAGRHPADVAHAADSFFHAATTAVLDAQPSATVVQLHGFARRADGMRAVVSNGTRASDEPLVDRVAAALGSVVGSGIKTYPRDTKELGATQNVQGIAVRRAGGHFVHIELDATLRKDLADDAQLRSRAFGALAVALSTK
jgi:hypothetical protein